MSLCLLYVRVTLRTLIERSLVFSERSRLLMRMNCNSLKKKTKQQNKLPDTLAFASSLRDPSQRNTNPLYSRDFSQQDRSFASIAEASIVAARCAAYSTALADTLAQADRLEVEEDYRRTVTIFAR